MKKTILLLLIVCLLGGAAAGILAGRGEPFSASVVGGADGSAASPVNGEESAAEPAETAGAQPDAAAGDDGFPELKLLDYEKLYASHAPEEVVAEINGREVSWAEYFYMLMSQTSQVEDYFLQMATYYGIPSSWADPVDESGMSFAQMAVETVDGSLLQIASIRGFAEDNGAALTEADYEALAAQLQADIAASCGEDATEEDFNEYIASIYLPREMYDRMNEINFLYRNGFSTVYGENGELLSEEAALAYLEENGYLAANHILLMRYDPATFEDLDEAALAEKQALAEKLAAELAAIEDPAALVERFRALKEEFCEDSGKTAYPDGYVFLPGEMVPEFEATAAELETYQVSGPVSSDYGWHIILRMPLDVDAVIQYSSAGSPMTARSLAANEDYGLRLQEYYDSLSIAYKEDFEKPDLLDYLS